MVTLYNAVSIDGFIARKDGSEDFIPEKLWDEFLNLCKSYDTLVMGRKTYEAIQHYDHSLRSFEELPLKRVVVSQDQEFQHRTQYIKVNSLQEAIALGINILISSGYILNSAALKEKLVNKVILRILPVAIKEGIEVFDKALKKLLILDSEVREEDGIILQTYHLRDI